MGCDFYIYPYLEIQHKTGISYYELSIILGYYCDLECGICDSDDDENDHYYNSAEYKKLYEDMIQLCLTPRKPVVIYENDSFVSPKLETKYLQMIQHKIDGMYLGKYPRHEDTGRLRSMSEIISVVKKEERIER